MARRTETVTIEGDPKLNRDAGKTFLITEMSAWDATMFGAKALLLLTNSGATVPDSSSGMAGLAVAGLMALEKLSFAQLQPLLVELIGCVQYVHRPGHPPQDARENIEEPGTYMKLFRAAFQLHTGFSVAGSTQTTG